MEVSKPEGDEFYEEIEAPKFVDFTTPDHYSPDDRYWFCLRVGCDQKHEEEMDSEAIYKNFVLRVMAARSPNVRLRKALTRKPQSMAEKCPLSAPPKPSRSRIPRLAVLSSISGKIAPVKEKVKSVPQVTATPNAKAKQASSVAKALTTPRNKNKISNPELFRSVRNPKGRSHTTQNKYGSARALKFPSPKKVTKNQISSELNTPIRKICASMKKLDIVGQKRNRLGYETSLSLAGTKKKIGAKEVKSRVYNSLHSEKCKGREIKSSRHLKEKSILKNLQHCSDSATNEGTSGDSSDMDVDDKLNHRFSEACTAQERSKNPEVKAQEECLTNIYTSDQSPGQRLLDASSKTSNEKANEGLELGGEDVANVAVLDEETVEEEKIQDNADKNSAENSLPANDEENGHQHIDNDEKENASAPDNNREQDGEGNRKIFGKLDNYEKDQKVSQSKIKSKKIISADKRSAQGGKYVKPRPTSPKPFRLRTDERGVLKEMRPLKDNATASGFSGGSATNKNRSTLRKNGQFSTQSNHNHQLVNLKLGKTPDDLRIMQQRIMSNLPSTSEGEVRQRPGTTTPGRYTALKQRKNLVHPELKARESIKEIRSLTVNGPEGPDRVPSCQLGVIRKTSAMDCEPTESSRMKEPGVSSASKASGSSGTLRSLSRCRRLPTIPKEPNFHSIHVPKSCIMKLT